MKSERHQSTFSSSTESSKKSCQEFSNPEALLPESPQNEEVTFVKIVSSKNYSSFERSSHSFSERSIQITNLTGNATWEKEPNFYLESTAEDPLADNSIIEHCESDFHAYDEYMKHKSVSSPNFESFKRKRGRPRKITGIRRGRPPLSSQRGRPPLSIESGQSALSIESGQSALSLRRGRPPLSLKRGRGRPRKTYQDGTAGGRPKRTFSYVRSSSSDSENLEYRVGMDIL